MTIDLPTETWGLILAMAAEKTVPRYIALPALIAFEQALQAAQQPTADDKEPA